MPECGTCRSTTDKIVIEAIGFRAFGEDKLLGVVLTPWFMNLIALPIEPVPDGDGQDRQDRLR